jgi:hypothetical protein
MISREEAIAVLSKLHSEDSKVLCIAQFAGFEIVFRGTIAAVSESALQVASFDKRSVIGLRLDLDGMLFEYAEPKDVPSPLRENVPEHSKDAATISIGLPLRVPLEGLADFIKGPLRLPTREHFMLMEERDSSER